MSCLARSRQEKCTDAKEASLLNRQRTPRLYRGRLRISFAVWAVFLAATGAALAPPTPLSDERGDDRVDTLARALMETAALPSISIAIARNGGVEYARAFGFADLEREVAATPNTQYRCASVSKVITATAVGRLAQNGRLDLDAPVSAYVPTWPSEPTITARQLSGHLSGLSHYHGEDRLDRGRYYQSVQSSLDVFRDSPRSGAAGEAYTYSTHGFTLLSAVAQGASGIPFLELLHEEVFEPLGMESSGADIRSDPPAAMSTLYARRRGAPFPIPRPEDPSYKWAGGGLISTPSDLVRLAGGYLDGYLTPQIVEDMWTTQRTNDGEETGVGVAWRIGADDQGRRVIHHSGSMGGARSTIVIWPDQREAIAVMTNVGWNSDIMTTGLLLMEAYRSQTAAASSGTSREMSYTGEMTRSDETGVTSGTLAFDGEAGWISMPLPFAEWTGQLAVERMPIHDLGADRYALVSPFGLMPLALTQEEGEWRGLLERGSTKWRFETGVSGPP